MIFFTRELYLGIQPQSGWERRAENEWYRRLETFSRYSEVIAPMLPSAIRRLCKHSLHDGVVCEAMAKNDELTLLVDATNALSLYRGRQVRLTFRGTKSRPHIRSLVGQWWLYQEAHLSSRARFSLQVLFDKDELEIEADELQIKLLPGGRRRKKKTARA